MKTVECPCRGHHAFKEYCLTREEVVEIVHEQLKEFSQAYADLERRK